MNTISGRHWRVGKGVELVLRDGVIAEMRACASPQPGILAPALVDLQVNGWGGRDLNDGAVTAEKVTALCGDLARLGVGAFLPTLITAAPDALTDALAVLRQARETDALAAKMIAGAHVEGPAVSPKDGARGAHPLAHVRPPSLEELAEWQRASGGLVRMVTLAPEWPEAEAFIRGAAESGVLVAIGHSAASAEQARAAADAGARVSTHLGNGAAAMLPRHPNHIWAQLADDRLTATLIADGHHLPADVFRVMVKAKGAGRTALISDSVAHGGMPPGRYTAAVGGEVEVSADGRIGLADTPYLAGAGTPLVACLGKAMAMAGLSLAEAVAMASETPAALLGRKAELRAGASADVIRLEEGEGGTPALAEVWLHGERLP